MIVRSVYFTQTREDVRQTLLKLIDFVHLRFKKISTFGRKGSQSRKGMINFIDCHSEQSGESKMSDFTSLRST